MRFDYAPGDILKLCSSEIKQADERIALLGAGNGFKAVVEPFETIIADLMTAMEPALFMMNVHPDPAIRDEAKQAQELFEKYFVELYTRKDLYLLLKEASLGATSGIELRLCKRMLRDFCRNGLEKDDATIAKVRALNMRLTELKTAFRANLNNNADYIIVEEDELVGLPEGFMERLERTPEGIKILTNAADVVPFMTHCRSSVARKRMQERYENREAETNTPLLTEAIALRHELARTLGYAHWGDYSTEEKMTKSAQRVMGFLGALRTQLTPLHKRDLKVIEAHKHHDHPSQRLQPWDITYYSNEARKAECGVDDEVLREYFPAEHVTAEMFALYSSVLGIAFREIEGAVWAEGVKLYEIIDGNGRSIAHFYTDFFPRNGKYSHFAAFNLRDRRVIDGEEITPVAAIVCNFTPPTETRPSLLTHDEVETLFHEFGHIMHTTLCKSEYVSLSSFRTAWDFIEAPSQIFENWIWDPTILKRVSKHHETGEPLPDDVIARLIASRSFLEGYHWMRQVLMSLYDMRLHTEEGHDPIGLYRAMYEETMGFEPVSGTHWPASWGHIMGGYEAGYYTYTWSKVIAQDLFTRFEHEGITSPRVGAAYREHILEPGDLRDAEVLIREFLGRDVSNDAFLRLIGIPEHL